MRFLVSLFILVSVTSCAGTNNIPPKPDYGTRADYPKLSNQKNAFANSDADHELPEFVKESQFEMYERWAEFYDQKGCKYTGSVRISFVVNKIGKIDAPVIDKSLSPVCDEVALIALRYLKVKSPGKVDGKPVNVKVSIPFSAKGQNDD